MDGVRTEAENPSWVECPACLLERTLKTDWPASAIRLNHLACRTGRTGTLQPWRERRRRQRRLRKAGTTMIDIDSVDPVRMRLEATLLGCCYSTVLSSSCLIEQSFRLPKITADLFGGLHCRMLYASLFFTKSKVEEDRVGVVERGQCCATTEHNSLTHIHTQTHFGDCYTSIGIRRAAGWTWHA